MSVVVGILIFLIVFIMYSTFAIRISTLEFDVKSIENILIVTRHQLDDILISQLKDKEVESLVVRPISGISGTIKYGE